MGSDAALIDQQIGETVAFDRAIRVGLKFAEMHPDTLVVVTADHARTSQIVPVPANETRRSWIGAATVGGCGPGRRRRVRGGLVR